MISKVPEDTASYWNPPPRPMIKRGIPGASNKKPMAKAIHAFFLVDFTAAGSIGATSIVKSFLSCSVCPPSENTRML